MHLIIQNIDLLPEPEKSSYADLRAICQILDTYQAWRTLDIYGAMPYHQAFNVSQYPLPAYDYEQTLYKTFDSVLKVAATVLNTNQTVQQVALGAQDFFYGGDIPSWEAFANTLRIKIAQRYEKRDASNLAAVLNDIASNFGGQIISNNAQSFGVNNTQGYQNLLDNVNILLDFDVSYAFAEFLKSTKDPRLPLLVRQNDYGTNDVDYNTVQQYGTPSAIATLDSPAINTSRYWGKHAFAASQNNPSYGLNGRGTFQSFALTNSSNLVQIEFLSNIQTRFLVKNGGFNNNGYDPKTATARLHTDESNTATTQSIPMRTLYVTYAETCFMMAEIAQKSDASVLGQTAAQWYNSGVAASVAQYQNAGVIAGVPGADTVAIGDYLTRYPYNNTLQQIYSQEWVHLMVEPAEAWAMWKRTGYPQFVDWRPGQETTLGNIGDGSGIVYLENLYDGSENLTLSRRSSFNINDAGSTLNTSNFNAAVNEMLTFNPAFGISGIDTRGRLWWDAQ